MSDPVNCLELNFAFETNVVKRRTVSCCVCAPYFHAALGGNVDIVDPI
jgi:hypothetical protein